MGDTAGGAYQHGPLVPPRPCAFNTDPNCYYWTFDPAEFTDQDGQKYLYYGSYFGGTLAQRLTADGLHLSGTAVQISHWDRYEGTYVVRHGGYYYNFSSTADCCRGPNTAYSVAVNRATSPLGPFTDQNGFPMQLPGNAPAPTTRPVDDPAGDNIGAQGGGYPTLKQNGNTWHGVGHNALITDLSGQDWIVYRVMGEVGAGSEPRARAGHPAPRRFPREDGPARRLGLPRRRGHRPLDPQCNATSPAPIVPMSHYFTLVHSPHQRHGLLNGAAMMSWTMPRRYGMKMAPTITRRGWTTMAPGRSTATG